MSVWIPPGSGFAATSTDQGYDAANLSFNGNEISLNSFCLDGKKVQPCGEREQGRWARAQEEIRASASQRDVSWARPWQAQEPA